MKLNRMKQHVKVVLVGKRGAGKSCIFQKIISKMGKSTLGTSYLSKVHNYGDGKTVTFQIWDTNC